MVLPELEKRNAVLSAIRTELRQPMDLHAIKEHERRYTEAHNQTLQAIAQARAQKTAQLEAHPAPEYFKPQASKLIEEDGVKQQLKLWREKQRAAALLQKKKTYAGLVKELYAPTPDPTIQQAVELHKKTVKSNRLATDAVHHSQAPVLSSLLPSALCLLPSALRCFACVACDPMRCAVLCCAVLCCAVLCCTVLIRFVVVRVRRSPRAIQKRLAPITSMNSSASAQRRRPNNLNPNHLQTPTPLLPPLPLPLLLLLLVRALPLLQSEAERTLIRRVRPPPLALAATHLRPNPDASTICSS